MKANELGAAVSSCLGLPVSATVNHLGVTALRSGGHGLFISPGEQNVSVENCAATLRWCYDQVLAEPVPADMQALVDKLR